MTKKHFVGIAETIRNSKPVDTVDKATNEFEGQLGQWARMTFDLADFCSSQNAQFDRAKFLKACGVTE